MLPNETITRAAGCRLCGRPKAVWQVYCGGACCVAYESGERDPQWVEKLEKAKGVN